MFGAEPTRYKGRVVIVVHAIGVTECVYFNEAVIIGIEFVMGQY